MSWVSRFWAKVDKRAEDECWPWTGAANAGYGVLRISGKNVRASKLSFILANGREPVGVVRHSCDNPSCCNPKHLLEGTQAQNIADMRSRGRANDPRGETHPKARITEAVVVEIRKLRASGLSYQAVATRLGLGYWTVYGACNGSWKHVVVGG